LGTRGPRGRPRDDRKTTLPEALGEEKVAMQEFLTGTSEAYWILTAPLGKLLEEKTLEECAESIRAVDALNRDRFRLSWAFGKDQKDFLGLVRRLLEDVRGEEGVLAYRVDGGGTLRYTLGEGTEVSVLTALGIHGVASVYVLHYGRVRLGKWGKIPHSPLRALKRVGHRPPVFEELQVVRNKILEKYPALKGALSESADRPHPPFFVEVFRRGRVDFAVEVGGWVTHMVVGDKVVFALDPPLDEGTVLDSDGEELTKALRRRTPLGDLSSRAVLALLRGEGDLKMVERVWGLTRLAAW
jgi:hypothetical protein